MSTNIKAKVSAAVEFTLDLSSSWGEDCQVSQAYSQGMAEAEDAVRKVIQAINSRDKTVKFPIGCRASVTSRPKITILITDDN